MIEGSNKIQVFKPYHSSLPPIKPYLKDFWHRREFATELSKFSDKAEYLESNLGKVWLVLNPLFKVAEVKVMASSLCAIY